jgi:hypothetical protein
LTPADEKLKTVRSEHGEEIEETTIFVEQEP